MFFSEAHEKYDVPFQKNNIDNFQRQFLSGSGEKKWYDIWYTCTL